MFGGIRLGKVSGIELYADWSVAVIFALVTFGLGGGLFPRWHPDWSPLLSWTVALAAAIAFFVSILLHELAHALVGRAFGMRIPRITLFVFGGMAHLQGEPSTPKAELLMAAVGPLTSLVLGVGSTIIGSQLALVSANQAYEAEQIARSAGPLATLLLWLGPINIILAIFNLVPGFPLDGGRVLRALLWWSTGNLDRATRWASGAGRAVGWGLMALGALVAFGFRIPPFGVGLGNGLWLIFIGWFLQNAARASYVELRVKSRLARVPVRDVMRSSLDVVGPYTTLAEVVRDHVMKTDQTSFPVIDGTNLVGVVSAREVQSVPSDRWAFVIVRDVMTSASDLPAVEVQADASRALDALASSDVDQVPVTDGGRLAGFVRRQDIVKWLSLQPDVGV
jgi:Zn-dependent protease/CBS domain-containing protein